MNLHNIKALWLKSVPYINKKWLLVLLSGISLGLPFWHPWFWWLVVVGLILTTRLGFIAGSARRALLLGAIVGFLHMLMVMVSVWSAYPMDWLLETKASLQFLGITLLWILLALSLGINLGLYTLASYYFKSNKFYYLILPFVLVGSELVGSWLLSFFMLGPGTYLNAHNSFGYLGYIFTNHTLFGLVAYWGGVYTLSFLVASVTMVIIYTLNSWHRLSKQIKYLSVTVLFFILIIPLFPVSFYKDIERKGFVIATINTSFPGGVHGNTANNHPAEHSFAMRGLEIALRAGADAVIFPEGMDAFAKFDSEDEVFNYLNQFATSSVVVDSFRYGDDSAEYWHTRSATYMQKDAYVHYEDKRYLVPVGEAFPYSLHALLTVFGQREVADIMARRVRYKQATINPQRRPTDVPLVTFCSEYTVSNKVSVLSGGHKVPFVAHPISHSWFVRPTRILRYQQSLKLMTASRQSRTPIIQASNMAPPAAYDANGRILSGEVLWAYPGVLVKLYEI